MIRRAGRTAGPQALARLAVGTALGAALLVACSPSAASSNVADELSSPVMGVVVAVDSAGLDAVRGFTLRTVGAGVIAFTIGGPLENAGAFPLGHLAEHAATSVPLSVAFRRSGNLLVVTRIEDAGP